MLPEGTGWILDGFPVTMPQAMLVVKAVSGYDAAARARSLSDPQDPTSHESTDAQKSVKRSKLLSDPRPMPESAPELSGLDAVIVLDVSDELCLLRAADTPRRWL